MPKVPHSEGTVRVRFRFRFRAPFGMADRNLGEEDIYPVIF